jgi:predicted secreted hydrolase
MNKTHTNLSQIVKDNGDQIDAHMWIEDDGKVIDYEDTDLAKNSAFGTSKIVRKEFPIELQVEVLKVAMKIYRERKQIADWAIMKGFECGTGLSGEEVGNCVIKAIHYKKLNKHAKIKIGSLGFIQPNGDIFYEWG